MCMDMTMLTSCGGCPNILPWEEKSGKSKGRFEGEDCEVREGVEDVICHAEERRCIGEFLDSRLKSLRIV